MRIVIVGAGNVGRSIARELTAHGHQILLIDKNPKAMKPDTVPEAEWLCADACELATLEEARIDNCDIAISATGDDKVNLVHSLLAKTEFGGTKDSCPCQSPRERVDVRPGVGRRCCRFNPSANGCFSRGSRYRR